jgi:hypothetical protein
MNVLCGEPKTADLTYSMKIDPARN